MWVPDLDEYCGDETRGITDFWDHSGLDYRYSVGRCCSVCGEAIENDSRYCRRHAAIARSPKIREQIARLIEIAQQRRVDEIARSLVPRMARVDE